MITGSHNLGYKASYDNDENLLIIRGNSALATAYAVHVLDVYQHYLTRAKQEDQIRTALLAGKKVPQQPTGHGFLQTTPAWQTRFFAPEPATARDYFLGIQGPQASAPALPVGLGSRESVSPAAARSKTKAPRAHPSANGTYLSA